MSIECSSYSVVFWYFNDGEIPTNAQQMGDKYLVVENISKENEGNYECEGTNEKKEKFLAKVTLSVVCESSLWLCEFYFNLAI